MLYDEKVKADLADGIIVVANEDPEPEVGAGAGSFRLSSVACSGAWLALNNSTICTTVAEIVSVG